MDSEKPGSRRLVLLVGIVGLILGSGVGWYAGLKSGARFEVHQFGPDNVGVMRIDRATGETWQMRYGPNSAWIKVQDDPYTGLGKPSP
jgi:hypothetical protein